MLAGLAALLLALPASAQDAGPLPPGEGRTLVRALCSACHSIRLVTQQGKSRERWDSTLDWMVEEQGMMEPGPENREVILDYLAEHFGEDAAGSTGGGAMSPWNN
ncbi:aldehyde dehydrogenase [Spiribacter halobius]|uniref:Aldehyde dehydrogenase n=1 Tax=Sediminicurvatus halobius TaxID=2182432 RepID=A0A2U2MXG7_9GAMM|nr:aldehyde dehydrogenase [Spiribacter halobius]